jgi:hypothetical protein
MIISTNG